MPKHYVNPKAKCKYYLHEDPRMIYCEGVQEGNVLHLAFASASDAKDYKQCRCQGDYKKCKVYEMLGGDET